MTVHVEALRGERTADQSTGHTTGGPVPDVAVLGLAALRRTPGWAEAMSKLRVQWQQHSVAARERARRKRSEFEGRRGTMVVDVVLSRQRRYDTHVQPCIRRWEQDVAERNGVPTLRWLVDHADLITAPALPLRRGEAATILGVAHALLRYGADLDLDPADEDQACRSWAAAVAGLEFAPALDPYVGAVSGIGAALFAYTRMLCGADTVKPDVRVLAACAATVLACPATTPPRDSSPSPAPPTNYASRSSNSTRSCGSTCLPLAAHQVGVRSGTPIRPRRTHLITQSVRRRQSDGVDDGPER